MRIELRGGGGVELMVAWDGNGLMDIHYNTEGGEGKRDMRELRVEN
jgi:hypothetical protein